MFSWNNHLAGVVVRLAKSDPRLSLGELQRLLAATFDAAEITFHDAHGHVFPPDFLVQQLVRGPFEAMIRVHCPASCASADTQPSRFQPDSAGSLGLPAASADERTEAFIREFVRLEQRSEFMWAGYIVREMLPRLGYPPEEAKVVLDQFRAEQIITVMKVPNPKNPLFPATGVQLNREHPKVAAIIAPEPQSADPAASPIAAHYSPI